MAKGIKAIAVGVGFYGQGRDVKRIRIGTEFDYVPTVFTEDGEPVFPKWAREANPAARKAAAEAKAFEEKKALEGARASAGNPKKVIETHPTDLV